MLASGDRLGKGFLWGRLAARIRGERLDMTAHTSESLQAAPERPGTYEIVVHHEGFQDWHTRGVRVTADECHVRTIRVVASMDSFTR